MSAEIVALLWRCTLWLSVGMIAVLVLRKPVRHLFGAQAGYALWALAPAILLAALMPASQPAIVILPSVRAMLRSAGDPLLAPPWQAGPSAQWVVTVAWFLGAVAFAIVLLYQQRRFVRSLGILQWRNGIWRSQSPNSGPALIGALRPRIVVPADFDARYDAHAGALIIEHERIHLGRGDAQVNALVAALRCLCWFNPLVHLAASRFRVDQELACDAAVIARFPQSRHGYAQAMLSTQLAVEWQRGLHLPVGCQWQFHHPLKERIMLLKRPIPSTPRRVAAASCVLALVAGASLTAWAAQADPKPTAKHAIDVAPIVNTLPSENVTYRRMQPPVYPESAIKARQSGRVILKVQVDDEGHAKSAEVDMAEPPEARQIFGESAVAAALKWTFNPGIKDGKPQGGWVLVPIDFAIDDEGGPADKSNLRG